MPVPHRRHWPPPHGPHGPRPVRPPHRGPSSREEALAHEASVAKWEKANKAALAKETLWFVRCDDCTQLGPVHAGWVTEDDADAREWGAYVFASKPTAQAVADALKDATGGSWHVEQKV